MKRTLPFATALVLRSARLFEQISEGSQRLRAARARRAGLALGVDGGLVDLGAEAERDAVALDVDRVHHHLEHLADLGLVLAVAHLTAARAQLGDVQQTLDARPE